MHISLCFILLLIPLFAYADVLCSDGTSKCPSGTTCCALGSGQFGCCPVVDAVCCEDHAHCCPQGTNCDVSEGRCTNRFTKAASPLLKKFPATKIETN